MAQIKVGRRLRGLAKQSLAGFGYEVRRVPRPTGSHGKRPLHFLHIGKNAGTQIAKLAEEVNTSDVNIYIHQHGHSVYLRSLPATEAYFFSIRDPISRFRSAFYSRKRKGQPQYYFEWNTFEEKAFTDFEHANDLAEALFEDSRSGADAFGAIKSIRHTAQNQVDWFYGCGNILDVRPPVAIIRQEYFDADFATFKERAGIRAEAPETGNTDRSHSNDYEGIPDFSDKAVANLRIWYAQDFEFYKNCVDWIDRNMSARGSA